MKQKIIAFLLALLLLALPLLSYAQTEHTVVTSFYPIYLLSYNLLQGVEGATLQNLAAPEAGCLHDYQLTTGDMRTLAGADLLVVNGAGMESFLMDVAAQFPSLHQVIASQGMTLGQDENAHLWLTPMGALQMAENIAAELTTFLPESREVIDENLSSLSARLHALDEKMSEALAPLRGKSIVTFHEAFPYFADAYGLNVAAVIEREPGEALSPAELKDLTETIRSLDNPPLFIEPQYPTLAAETLSAETGALVYLLDPIVTGPVDESAMHYYEAVMEQNMQTLLDALSDS